MNELALFAGSGGGLLASDLLGWNTVGACEIQPYPREVLLQRQRDGYLPKFPIWDDVTTFDGRPWKGSVDVISGGFPCQDISSAGQGKGIEGERSSLWKEYARIIGEVKPQFVFAENSPLLRTRGLVTILKDLSSLGYNARWCVLGAGDFKAPHQRKRMWIMATHSNLPQCKGGGLPSRGEEEHPNTSLGVRWKDKPGICGVDDGMAYRLDRLKAVGNGQVPVVAAHAWNILNVEEVINE